MIFTQTVAPGPILPVLNLPSAVGEVPLVAVWVTVSLLLNLTIPFAAIVMLCGLNAKFTIETFVVPDAGHATIWALCVDVAVKFSPVISAPLTVCDMLAGVKV